MHFNRKCSCVAVVLLALSLGACQQAPVRVDAVAESQRLLQADRDFAALADRVGDAEAFHTWLAEGATQFPADQPPRRGREAICDSFKSLQSVRLVWTPKEAEVSDDGSMGWTWGEWMLVGGKPAEAQFARGKYLDVWKRQSDGSWKVVADIGNAESKK